MSTSISRSVLLCSVFSSVALLSACSDKAPADVSFQDIDRSEIPTNIVANDNLNDSNTEWTGWSDDLEVTNGALAEFALEAQSQGGNSLKVNVINVEANTEPNEIQAGPFAVPVTPGQAYGAGAFVKGPRCGLATFVVHAEGDTENVLAEEQFFFSGDWQSFDYYFQVPDAGGVESVNMPVQLATADNIGGEIFLDRIIAIPTIMPAAQSEGNVAPNSSFEESDTEINVPFGPTNQNSWGQFGPATFTLDTTEAQDGNNSVRIDFEAAGSGNPYDIEAGPINVAVVDGWTYTFSGWIKGDEGATANFLIQNPTAYNVFSEQAVVVTSEWQEVRFETTITGTNVVRLYAQYNFAENTDKTIYIDNIKLIPPDTCPYAPVVANMVSENTDLFEYNHVTNGGLEDSAEEYTGWDAKTAGSAQAAFEIQNVQDLNRTLINSGNRSLKVSVTTAGTNPWDIQAGPASLIVVPGQTYIYSGFARGPAGSKANFTAANTATDGSAYEEQLVTFDNLWQQISFDFSVPEDAPLLTEEELAAAGLPADAVATHLLMAVNMSYPENVGKHLLLDDFTLLLNAANNGDLENSSATAEGWSWQASSEAATFALDTTESHTGNNSLRVDIAAIAEGAAINLWDIQAGIADIPVVGGRTYFISTRIKGDAGSRAKILVDLAEDPYTEIASESGVDSNDLDSLPDGIEITDQWQEITFEANIPEGVEAVRLMAQLGYAANSGRAVYLDTFRVVSQIPPPPKAESANIVTNGGLEVGKTDGWNANNATIAVTTSQAGVYSGNFGLHVTGRTANWNSAQYSLLDKGLVEGASYSTSAWVKVDGVTADVLRMTLQISYDSGDPDYIGITASGAADTLAWTKLNGIFNYVPDSTRTVTDAKVYIEADGATTAYFIDELFVTKVFTTNGNLESGDTTGWNGAGAQIAVTAAEAHSGSNSLHVTGRTANWNSAQFDLLNSGMEPGRTYQISAWVKIEGATPDNVKMTIELADDDNTDQYFTIAQSADTLGWVELSNTYTFAPDGEATVFKVYFEADGVSSAYYIDDLLITEVIPPVNLIANGNLELGRTDGWNANNATIATTVASQGVHSGNFGLHVTGRTANWNSAQFGLMEAGLEEGASYTASAWVKVDGATADVLRMTLQISYDSGDPAYIGITASGAADTLAWTKLSGLINYAPDSTRTVTDVKVYIEADGATTAYFIDDLIIQQMFTPNGDLESDSNPTGWNSAGSQIAVTTEEAFSGTQSLHVTGRTANWNSAQYDLLNSGMEAGKAYDISAWVKIEGDTADNIKMTVELVDEDDLTNQYMTIAQSSETLTWVKLSSRYTYAPGGAATVFKVYFEAEGATSSYYIDNLVITEASEINPN
jgi:hypothetical protein